MASRLGMLASSINSALPKPSTCEGGAACRERLMACGVHRGGAHSHLVGPHCARDRVLHGAVSDQRGPDRAGQRQSLRGEVGLPDRLQHGCYALEADSREGILGHVEAVDRRVVAASKGRFDEASVANRVAAPMLQRVGRL